jgi:hypothetical protein
MEPIIATGTGQRGSRDRIKQVNVSNNPSTSAGSNQVQLHPSAVAVVPATELRRLVLAVVFSEAPPSIHPSIRPPFIERVMLHHSEARE